MTTKQQIQALISDTMMTSSEIVAHLGISYGTFYKHVKRTDSDARDANIAIYGPVGHDGSKDEDRCLRCSIILLRDYSKTPAGWGDHQRAMGNVCAACFDDLRELYPQAMNALQTSECTYCNSRKTEIFFVQEGVPGMVAPDPVQAIPLCEEHRRILHDKTKSELLRDFYNRTDTARVLIILDWACHNPMPFWDVLCPNCGERYMPDGPDMLLGPEFWQCRNCDLSDDNRVGTHCPKCCPSNVQ